MSTASGEGEVSFFSMGKAWMSLHIHTTGNVSEGEGGVKLERLRARIQLEECPAGCREHFHGPRRGTARKSSGVHVGKEGIPLPWLLFPWLSVQEEMGWGLEGVLRSWGSTEAPASQEPCCSTLAPISRRCCDVPVHATGMVTMIRYLHGGPVARGMEELGPCPPRTDHTNLSPIMATTAKITFLPTLMRIISTNLEIC